MSFSDRSLGIGCDNLSILVDHFFQVASQEDDKEAGNPEQESGAPY
jgi:hypothetical protein